MNIKRLFPMLLVFVMLASTMGTIPALGAEKPEEPAAASVEIEPADPEPTMTELADPEPVLSAAALESQFEDRNRMTDEEFFGRWDEQTQQWNPEPKLDYSYAPGLEIVERYVMEGDIANAREALLHYYQNRELKTALPTGRNSLESRISMEGIHTFESPALGLLSVGTAPKEYKVNVTNQVKSNVSCFLIQSMKRESTDNDREEIVRFHSKESGDHPPVLEIKQGEQTTQLPVLQDMYIRGGDFSGENYGAEEELLVSEGGQIPSGNGTRQAHVRFDLSKIDAGKPITSATLRLYGSATCEGKEVVVFSGVENTWEESVISYANLPIRVMSWNNNPGGYDWLQPDNAHAQFYNVQIRLLHVPRMFAEYFATKDERYALAAINEYLDFIGDNGGLLYDPLPREAALNAGFRGDPYSVSAFFGALGCDGIIDGTAITSLAKFMWQEAEALTIPKNEWRKHNGQAFQIDSLLRYIAYFPEFRDREQWVESLDRRVIELAEDLLYEDGGYLEATSGYDSGVLNTFTGLYTLAEVAGIALPAEFDEAYQKFGTAEMNLTMPNGVQWGWGDGGPAQMRGRIKAVGEITGDDEMLYFGTIGESVQKGRLPDYTSYYLPVSQLAVMRNNWRPDGVSAFLQGRSGGGHGHASVNQMLLYAYGRYLLADTGMSSYDTRDPNYSWQFLRTESHNTVEVNSTGQAKSGTVDTSVYLNPRADYYAAESNAYLDFPHTRKVLFVKNSKFFIVSDFLKSPQDSGVNQFNQTWHSLIEAKPVLNEENKIAKTTYSTGANLEIVPVDPAALTSATLDDGVGLGEANNVRNTGPKKHVSYKISKEGNAKFNTVLYPFEGSVTAEIPTTPIPVSDSADDSASAFSMTLPDGTKAVYYVNFRPEKIRRFDWYDVDGGTVYMEFDSKNQLKFFTASDVNFINQNGENLMRSSRKLTDISASFSGNVANLQTTQELDLSKDYIRMYAPGSVKATLNGEEQPFLRIGDDIVIGNFTLELKAEANADGTKTAIAPETTVSYPVELPGQRYWVELKIAEGTQITGPASWDGTIAFRPLEQSPLHAGSAAYGKIPFSQLETNIPVRVGFESKPNWRAAPIRGNSVIEPVTVLTEDSFDAAGRVVTAAAPAYYQSAAGSATYVSGLRDLLLYSETAETPPPSGGGSGGGGGGGGGGGHIWPSASPAPSPTPTAPPVDPEPEQPAFDDISGHWAEADILSMAEQGYVSGREPGRFEPDGEITRAEFTEIIARLVKLETKPYEGLFSDVPDEAWYAVTVEAAARAGILSGTGEGFSPDARIKRGEMARILANVWAYLGMEPPATAETDFTDRQQFAPWEAEAIAQVCALGLMRGMPDGSFSNTAPATRAEAVTVLKRLIDQTEKGEPNERT